MNRYSVFVYFFLITMIPYAVGEDTWRTKMKDLSQALSDIVPELFSMETTRQQAADLKRKTERIYAITQKLENGTPHAIKAPDSDPALPYIAQLFNDNIARANESIKEGHLEFAKSELRASVAYCIACHTQSKTGPQFPLLRAFSQPLKKASWIERLSFEAASRQFDTVYSDVMTQLKKGLGADLTAFDLEKAVRIALAISIRVKNNPDKAIQLSQAVIDSPYVTESLKRDAAEWLIDLKKWRAESNDFKTAKQMIERARELVGESKTWPPHSEVRYLRASVLMHDLIRKFPNSPELAEAFYITGLSYDRLHDLGLWSLHEMYFQACIKKSPHTQLAERCYHQYADSVTLGFTGSAGTMIPGEVQAHLTRMRKLATRVGK